MPSRILIVEDDPEIIEVLEYNLQRADFETSVVLNGNDALEEAIGNPPDLVLLDLLLPGANGLEVCRLLKQEPRTNSIPVVMVTAKGEEVDRIVGLELGADDYITKPFSPRELVLRIRAVLRRAHGQPEPSEADTIRAHGLTIDLQRHQVSGEEGPIELTATEFRMLEVMAASPGRVFTRSILMDRVWDQEYYGLDRTVDTHISRLRRKLGPYGKLIETVQGVGYRFKE